MKNPDESPFNIERFNNCGRCKKRHDCEKIGINNHVCCVGEYGK